MKKTPRTTGPEKAHWNKQHTRRTGRNNETPEIVIDALTNAGDGLGKIDQQVVFVPYTMPGDRARIRVVQNKKSFKVGQFLELTESSPDRIEPICPYFTQCGGCDWQHIPYPLQLTAKLEQLQETMTRIAGLSDLPIAPVIKSNDSFHYRNRIQGQIRNATFFYQRKRDGAPVAIEQCAIADPRINDWLHDNLGDSPTGAVEISVTDNSVVVNQLDNRRSTELGFRQVNSAVSEMLNSLIYSCILSNDCTTLYDLYCGRGTWSIEIARRFPELNVTGIDSQADNIQAAKLATQKAGVKNATFKRAKVESLLATLKLRDSVCIVDPPRAGLDAKIRSALSSKPAHQLIYVSCHPASLARDLKGLVDAGYRVETMQPLDMFPQTAHLECFVNLLGPA